MADEDATWNLIANHPIDGLDVGIWLAMTEGEVADVEFGSTLFTYYHVNFYLPPGY